MSSIADRQRERFRADPTDRHAFEALEEHLFLGGDWEGLVSLYDSRLAAPDLADSPRERARMLFRMGQVWEERRGDVQRAEACFRQAVATDSGCRPALTELRRIHADRGQWDVALQIAEAEASLEMTSAERAALLAEAGAVWLERLGDAQEALSLFERALELEPKHEMAVDGAARACEVLERPVEAAGLWERLAALVAGPPRSAALVARARLLAQRLGDPSQAAELYRRALTEDPRNLDALEALITVAEATEQWRLLPDLYERHYELSPDAARRAETACAAGRLHLDRLGDAETARVWLRRASELGASGPGAYAALADLERETGDDAALTRALERQVAQSGDRPSISSLLELASLLSDERRDEDALTHLRRALELAPEDALVVEALSDTFARLGRHEELVDCLERRAALAGADPATHASVLAELGELHWHELEDIDAARHDYERAFEADPTCPGVIPALERIYRKSEAWESLRDLLGRAGLEGPPESQASSLCALGELLAERFGDAAAATSAFKASLTVDRGFSAAHRGLQRLASEAGDEDDVLEAYEREATATADAGRLGFLARELAGLLERREMPERALAWAERWIAAAPEDLEALRLAARLRESLGHDAELFALLERLDPLLQGDEQTANRRRIAALHLERGRPEEALAAYRSALATNPGDVEALAGQVDLLEAAGRSEELAPALRDLAELLPPPQRAERLDSLARLLDEQLGDPSGAIDALVRLADTDGAPDDVEDRLEALLERMARSEELAERLARRLAAVPPESDAAQRLMLRRSRVLLEQLSDFEGGVAAFREVLSRDPDCAEAREGLERGLRASGETAALAEFLADRLASEPEPASRDRLAFERAIILEQALQRPGDALKIYRDLSISAVDADDRRRAADRLESLLERTGDWQGLRAHWEAALEAGPESDRGIVHQRLARLCRHRLDDAEGAIQHFEASAALAPERAELWQELAQLYEEGGRASDLVRVLEAELEAAPVSSRELPLRRRVARIWLEELADPARALPHHERILALDPGDSVAGEFLIHWWEEQGRLDEVARILERKLEALDELPRDERGEWAGRRTSLRLRIAGLQASELDDLDSAIATLEPALGEIGPRAVVAEPLADLYQRAGYPDDLIELCRRAAEHSEAGPERAGWYARLGDALRARGDRRDAADAFRRVLDERPDDRSARAALRDLYRRLGEAEPLARLLEAELGREASPEEVPLRMELASLLAGRLGRVQDALQHLRRVVEIDPRNAEAQSRGLELAEHLDAREVVVELLDAALSRPQPAASRAALLTRRGRLFAAMPDRSADAVADYREALGLEPTRTDVRRALRELLEAGGDWEAALDCLHQEAAHAAADERPEILQRAADTAWQRLGPEAALPWLERLRRERPTDPGLIARIAEIHRLAGRPVARLRALEAQTALELDTLSRRELLVEQARILEHEVGAPGRAVQLLEQAREIAPREPSLLTRLDRLYRGLGFDRERVGVLEALAELGVEAERVSLLCEAANLHERLGERRLAVGLLLRAVAETPKTGALRSELLCALGKVLQEAGPPDTWARCAEAELESLDPQASVFEERRLALRRELARSYEKAGRLDAAARHLRHLADEAPPDFDHSGQLDDALLRGLRVQRSWAELERRLSAHLEHYPQNAEGWLELARLLDEKLCAPAAAARAYERLLEIDPGRLDALRGLRAVSERLGDWQQVASTLEREAAHPDTRRAALRSSLYRRLGDVCWEHLHSTTRASRSYAAALEANAEDFEAHRALERLLEAMEDWRGALDLYESEVEVLGEREPERRQATLLRVGQIAQDHTGEAERAVRAYVKAAAIAPLPLPQRLEQAELHQRCGEYEAFAEVYASWCDDEDSPAGVAEHVRLAEALQELGRSDDAVARVERALALDEESAAVWDLASRLHAASGDEDSAARALDRASQLARDGGAAQRLQRAAALRGDDASAALELLRRAAGDDPACASIRADLALAAWRAEDFAAAEEAAANTLELCDPDDPLGPVRRLEIALVGGRSASRQGRAASAADLFGRALSIWPDHPEALAGAGEARAETGDLEGAREALAARLEHEEPDPDAARHHALLARCLEAAGEPDEALAHCERALAEDPGNDAAHGLCIALHEAADRVDEGCAALERWARAEAQPERGAEHLLRAAEWELRVGERSDAAERHLREALEADPTLVGAWQQLAALLWSAERVEEALDAAARGLEQAQEPGARAPLCVVQARALERLDRGGEAAEAWGIAAADDPGCIEAAIAQARLLRGSGDWNGAAAALDTFVRRSPGDDAHALAEALQQLGRLRAGPLEDVDGAIEAYRRAVELEPGEIELRTTLAQLLAHQPGSWREALEHHRAVLERAPLHSGSLRAVLAIARQRASQPAQGDGRTLLRALGIASPGERDGAPERLTRPVAGALALEEPLWEALRQAVQKVGRELGEALEAPEVRAPLADEARNGDAVAAFRAAALENEARLTAPALLPLSSDRLGEVVLATASLALESEASEGSGSTLNALAGALGRRARRRVRRILGSHSLDEIRSVDFARWRREVRALAAARAADETGCDLRTALLALVCDHDDRSPGEIPEEADLTPLVEACPEAHALVRSVVRGWLTEIEA